MIPITAKLKTIAWAAVGIGIAMMLMGLVASGNPDDPGGAAEASRWPGDESASLQRKEGGQIGHMAHLGGALFGWAFIAFVYPRLKQKKHDQSRRQRWGERFGASKVVDADYVDEDAERRRRARERKKKVSKEVDVILEKISAEGMHSLTKEERKILDESSDQLG